MHFKAIKNAMHGIYVRKMVNFLLLIRDWGIKSFILVCYGEWFVYFMEKIK